MSENQNRPCHDVLLESKQVFQRLLQLVEALPEEELTDAQRTEWFVTPRWHERRALWKCIADDSFKHYRQHIPDIRDWLERMQADAQRRK